jgi:hypothetical protein
MEKCTNLNPYTIIHLLWHTARLFKKCVTSSSRPINDDWFDTFWFKVTSCNVPSEDEANQKCTTRPLPLHVLLNPFSLSELIYAISFRRSSASGLENISPLILKNLPPNALEVLLRILNNILTTQRLPSSLSSFHVILIPKANSFTSFRCIALSTAVCKIFEHIVKSRLDWWLESKEILFNNLFSFCKGKGTLKCLSVFSGHIYRAFNDNKIFGSHFYWYSGRVWFCSYSYSKFLIFPL